MAGFHIAFQQDRVEPLSRGKSVANRKIRLHIKVRCGISERPIQIDESSALAGSRRNDAGQIYSYGRRAGALFGCGNAINLALFLLSSLRVGLGTGLLRNVSIESLE